MQSGHLTAARGRSGGTFVADSPPPADPPSPALLSGWRDICDQRLAVELAVAVLAAERAEEPALALLDPLADAMDAALEDFPAFRRADVRWHIGLAEATGSDRLVAAATEAQGGMSDLIGAHRAPARAAGLDEPAAPGAARARCGAGTATGRCGSWPSTCKGTEHVLSGLLPAA